MEDNTIIVISNNDYYAYALVRSPEGTWHGIYPAYAASKNDYRKFSEAIELAYKASESYNGLEINPKDQQDWATFLETIQSFIMISWEKDGSVEVMPWKRFPPDEPHEGPAFQPIIEKKVILSSSVQYEDIAKVVMYQAR